MDDETRSEDNSPEEEFAEEKTKKVDYSSDPVRWEENHYSFA